MNQYFGVKVKDIFNTMEERFRPEGAEGLAISFGFEIKGEGRWKLDVSKGSMKLTASNDLDGCDLTLITDGRTFAGISLGKMDAMEAVSSRKLKINGSFKTYGLLNRMFVKYVLPGEKAEPDQELIVLKKTISVNQRFATGPVMGKFLKALKEKKIFAIKCPECGRLQSPPMEVCANCRTRNEEWVEIGPKGEMRMLEYCFYASPDPLTGETRETPYGAIGILLDGCKGEEVFWHLLKPDQLDQVKMGIVNGDRITHGTRVRPVWADQRLGSIEDIKYFEIDEEEAGNG